jgi:hypothetical protein
VRCVEQNRWTAGFDGNALPRDGSGLVFDSTVLIDAAYIPPRTTLYARSWALPDAVPDTEGPHGDGNHHGPEHATP